MQLAVIIQEQDIKITTVDMVGNKKQNKQKNLFGNARIWLRWASEAPASCFQTSVNDMPKTESWAGVGWVI